MAKILVETPTFDLAITVPEGIDSRADAADVVEAMAQKLANRSAFLKGYTDHAALLNSANTFTQITTFLQRLILDVTDASQPVMDVDRTASEGSQSWKPILRAALVQRSSGSASATLYVRDILGNERMVLATNAEWTGTAWHQTDSTKSSTAIMFSSTGTEALGVCRMPAGAANWTTWGFGTLTAGDFKYNKTRTIPIPLGNSSADYDVTAGPVFGSVLAMSASGNKHFALRFPDNMGSGVLQIMHSKSTSSATVFEVCGFSANWSTPGTLTKTTMGTQVSTSTPGDQISSINVGPPAAGTEYRLRWSPASTGDRLLAVQVVGLVDAGPLNML